ncbi:putative bcs1 AAA-type ATPase [Aspergillus ellipticus CBS 707.79]|uniref:Putative bcs1 AAA-type ATPase n=1 Tax=Aspergillus ellipticus CBS 707.79 TaxID=1448320 RepID=A0A319DRA2_9EURO|nr:putative bcs1 AAA-type ATPase [Aspergillus ellipticus CBS 707.79]
MPSPPADTSDELPVEALLESFIPGYKFFSHLCTYYFRIDISSYLFIVAVLFAFWTYAAKAFWDRFQSFLCFVAATVEIRSHDDLHNDAMRWVSINVDLTVSRKAVAGTKRTFPWEDKNNEDDLSEADRAQFDVDPSKPWLKRHHNKRKIRYTPGPLRFHRFTYKRCWIFLYRQAFRSPKSPWAASMEDLSFYAAPWNKWVLRSLISDMQQASFDQDSYRINIRRGLKLGFGSEWVHVASKKPRELSTIILRHEQKKHIIEDVRGYLDPDTRAWYEIRGIPYRRGYLLHGLPGTGKSTMCLVLASLFNLDIYTVNLCANSLDENTLTLLFQSLPKFCIVVFEDVDQAGIPKRKTGNSMRQTCEDAEHDEQDSEQEADNDKQPSNGITLSAFLNIIDGLTAQEGRILIMTTNAIEKLDHALLRPGRVDLKVEFGHADALALQEHFLMFFMQPAAAYVMGDLDSCGRMIVPYSLPACSGWTTEYIVHLSTMFAENVPPNRYTAAEVQNYLLQYRSRPLEAVNNAHRWVDKRQAPFDIDFAAPLSTFRIADSPDLYAIHGRAYSIQVSAVIFSYTRTGDGRTDETIELRALLLQRASNGSKEGYWDIGPGGCVETGDATLQDAIEREVMKSTGLPFSKIVHSLSVKQWSRSTHSEQREWIEFPYIISVSESDEDIPLASSGRAFGRISQIEGIAKEYEDFAWATEAEIRAGKYKLHEDHQNIILECFEKERTANKRLP